MNIIVWAKMVISEECVLHHDAVLCKYNGEFIWVFNGHQLKDPPEGAPIINLSNRVWRDPLGDEFKNSGFTTSILRFEDSDLDFLKCSLKEI